MQFRKTPGNKNIKTIFKRCLKKSIRKGEAPEGLKRRFFTALNKTSINKHSIKTAGKVFCQIFPQFTDESKFNNILSQKFAEEVKNGNLPGPTYVLKRKDQQKMKDFFAKISVSPPPQNHFSEFDKVVDKLHMRPKAKIAVKKAFRKAFPERHQTRTPRNTSKNFALQNPVNLSYGRKNQHTATVDIANIQDLDMKKGLLTKTSLSKFCERVNHHTIDKPYAADPKQIKIINGQKCYRPNHNGTHAARQMRFTEVLIDQIKKNGRSGGNESPAFRYLFGSESKSIKNLAQLKQQLMLAAYFIRAGRVDESGDKSENRAILTRSAEIYGKYASQMGVDKKTIDLMKVIIRNSTVSNKTRYDHKDGVRTALKKILPHKELDDKTEMAISFSQILQTAHIMDLTRDYGIGSHQGGINPDTAGNGNIHIETLFSKNRDSKKVKQLLNFAVKAQNATGDHGATKKHRNRFSSEFAACSKSGNYCWNILSSTNFP